MSNRKGGSPELERALRDLANVPSPRSDAARILAERGSELVEDGWPILDNVVSPEQRLRVQIGEDYRTLAAVASRLAGNSSTYALAAARDIRAAMNRLASWLEETR